MKFETMLQWVQLLFPAWTNLHAKALAAMFGLLKAGVVFEEARAIRIALAEREFGEKGEETTKVLYLRLYIKIAGDDKVRYVEESVPLLVALGFANALEAFALQSVKLRGTFHGVRIVRNEDPNDNVVNCFARLLSEVEQFKRMSEVPHS